MFLNLCYFIPPLKLKFEEDRKQDDGTQWTQSDVTATSSKLPYKAAFPPNKAIKKSCGPPSFQNGLKTGWTTVF